jgi:hypothetical protein
MSGIERRRHDRCRARPLKFFSRKIFRGQFPLSVELKGVLIMAHPKVEIEGRLDWSRTRLLKL